MGINLGKQTMYHMCKTWLQKVHGGWDTGGVTFIRAEAAIQINYFLCFISC